MTAAVMTNLALLLAAPGGIKALRQLVLDLAIAGRLLPQQSSDQPAEAVLIATTVMRSCTSARRSGSIRGSSRSEGLPSGWVATTVGDVLICRDGERVPVSQADREVRPKIYDYYGASGVIDKIDGYLFDKPLLLVGEDGANLINRSTPIAFIARGKYWVNNHAHVLDGVDEDLLRYMALYFNAIDLKPYVTGTAQPKLNQAKLNAIPVSLPPQAEQCRIVAKVDELMALCDRLEARQLDAQAAHAKLVQVLLDSLTQARDADEFLACWERLAGQFDTVLTTNASVDALRSAVLTLAINGMLTRSKSADGDVLADLAKCRISARPHEREGWAIVALGDMGAVLGGATPSKARPDFWIGDIPWVSPKDMKRPEIADAEDHVSEAALGASPLKLVPADSILMVVRGMILAHSFPVARTLKPVTINQDMKALVPPAHFVPYLLLSLQALKPKIVAMVDRSSHGTCKLVSEKLWALEIALPPLAEQRRIVTKVTELLALCDQLKARIAAARAKHAQLAQSLVEAAVA